MKNIIVFGGSGGTGLEVIKQALEAGYHVTAIIRSPDAFPVRHEQLKIIQGDVLKPDTYENTFFGIDAVISCLGTKDRKPTTVYSDGITNIMHAMQKTDVKRLVCLSAGAVEIPPYTSLLMIFIIKNILQRLFKYSYADMLIMESILLDSDLDWTIIRPPRLLNGDKKGKYRASINEYLPKLSSITRADLADYIIQHLDDEKTYKSRVEISY